MTAPDRREQILAAALRAFDRHGYQNTSVEHVCQEAGIARGTLYQYFTDKKALFRELLRLHVERIVAHMVPFPRLGLTLPNDRDALARLLEARIRTIFETFLRERKVYALLLKEAMAKTAGSADIARQLDSALLAMMEEELSAAQKLGVVAASVDAAFVANFLLGGILKTAQEYIFDAADPPAAEVMVAKTMQVLERLLPHA